DHDVPEVLVVMTGHAAFPGVGEQVLDREKPTEVHRCPVVRRPFDDWGRGLVERDLEGLPRVADEFHKREIVHAPTASDQETGICESGQQVSRWSGVKHQDSIERLVGY